MASSFEQRGESGSRRLEFQRTQLPPAPRLESEALPNPPPSLSALAKPLPASTRAAPPPVSGESEPQASELQALKAQLTHTSQKLNEVLLEVERLRMAAESVEGAAQNGQELTSRVDQLSQRLTGLEG